MSVKNVKNCAPGGGNVGVSGCWNDIGIPRAIFFVGVGDTFDATTVAGLKTLFAAALLNDSKADRLYPIQGIEEITDSTTAPNVLTFAGTGRQIVTGENDYVLKFRWVDGGFCLLYDLRKSKGQNKAFFIIDSYANLIGTDAGGNLIKGITGYNYTEPFKWAVSNATYPEYTTSLSFRPEQVNDNIAIISFANDGGLGYLEGLNGLFDVILSQGAAPTSTTFTIKAATGCNGLDLYPQYSAALAVVGAWVATDPATGNILTISAVTASPTLKSWVITVTTPTTNVVLSLAGPTELAALGTPVIGYESNTISQAHA